MLFQMQCAAKMIALFQNFNHEDARRQVQQARRAINLGVLILETVLPLCREEFRAVALNRWKCMLANPWLNLNPNLLY